MYSDNLSRELRTALQPAVKFRQLCDAKDAAFQGLGKGATFHWDVYGDVSDTGTAGKTGLTETNTMPEDNFTITQGTLTINEFGRAVRLGAALFIGMIANCLRPVSVGFEVAASA